MSFYDLTSTLLTIIGYVILVYRIVFQLDSGKTSSKKLQKLCTKWIIFTMFLKVQYYILAIVQILPFGALALIILKLLLFLPQNAISHSIYKRIQKKLQKIKLEQYNSVLGAYLSLCAKFLVKNLIRLIQKIAGFVNHNDIEEIQGMILDVIKVLEYKRSAINVRGQAIKSQVNKDLDATEFNVSVDDGYKEDEYNNNNNNNNNNNLQDKNKKSFVQKSVISSRMSKILADDSQSNQTTKLKCQLMIVKPDKLKGIKPKYEDTLIQYYFSTSKITFKNKNNAVQVGTLKEVKWITKNMINIELLLEEKNRSYIIKLKGNQDVAKWVEPVCLNIEKRAQK